MMIKISNFLRFYHAIHNIKYYPYKRKSMLKHLTLSNKKNRKRSCYPLKFTLQNFAPFFLFFNLRSNREPCGFCFTLRLFSSKAFVSNFFFSLMHFTSYLLLSKYCFNSSTSFTMTSAPASCNSSSSP